LVAGTGSSYTTTATTVCSINGKFATTLVAQNNTASPTSDAHTGASFLPLTGGASVNQACMLVWGVNAAGAIKLCQGPIVNTEIGVTTTAGNFVTAPMFPSMPDDFCPIGYQLVRTSPTGTTFTPGTTAWTASGITASVIQNIATLPARPQIA
jgi:hypothetical protein